MSGGPGDDDIHKGVSRFPFMCVGVVVDRDDPEQLRRVRVRIPGLVEPASAWARPMATGWGGTKNRGIIGAPLVGAEVAVFFDRGDPEKPFYTTANWGKPGGETELPEQAARQDNVVLATETFRIEFDETAGANVLRISNVKTGDNVVIDAKRNTVMVAATTRLILKAEGEVLIDAPVITIGGRAVSIPSAKPI